MEAEPEIVDLEREDRIKMIRTTNRLTLTFGIWAGVVAVVGGLSLFFLQSLQSEMDRFSREHTELLLHVERIDGRQQFVLQWIAKEEAREKEEGHR